MTDRSDKRGDRRGLGRGLSALMADVQTQGADDRHEALVVSIDQIAPNPDQPRRTFGEDALKELAASIAEKGIIQPLILRRKASSDAPYEIVAGERRWRAAQIAQLHNVPAIIRDLDDTEVLEIAIIENIQRTDLSPIDEAAGYRHLMDRFGRTQEQMSRALGKSRSHIANLLRLLTLPQEVQDMLSAGRLTAGHARALVTAAEPAALARRIVEDRLSVRQTEDLVQRAADRQSPRARVRPDTSRDFDTETLEGDIGAALSMPVRIDHAGSGGRLTITYRTLDQLDALCGMLTVGPPVQR